MGENQNKQDKGYDSLGGKKVLVAEDHELNQFLTRHMLESWKVEVAIAENGRSALDLLLTDHFDCILMDVHMPEMDGIEATQHIRKLADPLKASVPIIALTASALKDDQDRFMAAGMNDFLAKPFDKERLFRVISRNLPHKKVQTEAALKPLNNHIAMTPRLYDLSMVQSVSGGDEAFIRKMIALFIQTVPQNLRDLRQAMEAGNWEQVGKVAHKLKSTVDSMGIKSIHQEIRAVEANAKQGVSLEEVPALVTRVESVISDCIGQLQAEMAQ